MQFIVELLAAIVVWAAGVALAQFGIEVDLSHKDARQERVIERTVPTKARPSAADCPEGVASPTAKPRPLSVPMPAAVLKRA